MALYKKPIEIIGKFIKEGELRVVPWLVQTTSFLFIILIVAFIVLDVMVEGKLIVVILRYIVLLLFIYLFVKKDINNYWEIKYLQHANSEIAYINEVTEALLRTMKLESVLQIILDKLIKELEFDRAAVFLVEGQQAKKFIRGVVGINLDYDILHSYSSVLDPSLGIIPRTAVENQSFIIEDAKNDYRCEQKLVEALKLKKFATIPLEAHDTVVGILLVDFRKKRGELTENGLRPLRIFANQAAIAIENARLYDWIRKLAITDGVTGLYNHRHFQEQLIKEVNKCRRGKDCFSLIMYDIDNFKNYNDLNGHQAGDTLLREMSDIIKESLRNVDFFARYGGEEFVIILPGTKRDGVITVAEKVRTVIETHPFANKEKQPLGKVTVSLGVSTFPEDASEPAGLINAADKRLYIAKGTGKNKVGII